MKECSRCRASKPKSDFYKSSQRVDKLQSSCKDCMAESYKRSRDAKIEHYREVQQKRTTTRTDRFKEWKALQKCACCTETDSCCLDLHHLDPSEKEVTVSNVTSYWSWERLITEINKCIVVCRNCHAKIHAGKIILGVG